MSAGEYQSLLEWLERVIVDPGGPEGALGDDAEEVASKRIAPRPDLPAIERLAIYHRMYFVRIEDALRDDFPATLVALGEERFAPLIRRYASEHPSRHPSLDRLGCHFEELVADVTGSRSSFEAELARLEWSLVESFHADEAPALDPSTLSELSPDALPRLRFRPRPSTHVVASEHRLEPYRAAVRRGQSAERPIGPSPSRLVLTRLEGSVELHELPSPSGELLERLLEGATLGEAIDVVPGELDPQTLFGWFRDWVIWGLFEGAEAEG
ncbi:MAG: DNA-binding domain-containing protein [Planctomycetota bacterium]